MSFNRRQFMTRTGGAITFMVGGLQLACSTDDSQIIDSAELGDTELLVLVRLFQRILPHTNLDSRVYVDAVTSVAEKASADASYRQMIMVGAGALGSAWLEQASEDQIDGLKNIETTPFFTQMKNASLEQVYRDERTWQLLGYEGEAIKFGGYINRGFNDIDWLPGDTAVRVEEIKVKDGGDL